MGTELPGALIDLKQWLTHETYKGAYRRGYLVFHTWDANIPYPSAFLPLPVAVRKEGPMSLEAPTFV